MSQPIWKGAEGVLATLQQILEPYKCMKIICIREEYMIYNCVPKSLKVPDKKYKYICTMNAIP